MVAALNAALVTAASSPAALTAAGTLGVRVDKYAAAQVQVGDLSTPDVAFMGCYMCSRERNLAR